MIDHDAGKHLATLPGFPGVAGVVADNGQILVTNRGSACVALLDANTLETRPKYKTGGRPNGAVIVAQSNLGIAACIGDDEETPTLQLFESNGPEHVSIDLGALPTQPPNEYSFVSASLPWCWWHACPTLAG